MKAAVYPSDWLFRDEGPALEQYGRRFLAEGDSWFTIGTLNLVKASNVLFKLEFASSTVIVNCAYPGDTLRHMVDGVNDVQFDRLLRRPRFARYWEAVVVSAGGNDLIDAAQVRPARADGTPIPQSQRLLRTAAEAAAGDAGDARSWISEAGWATLEGYLVENFATLVRRRDEGPSHGRPIFLHTYAMPTARPAGTVGAPTGWLWPAFETFGVPGALRQDLTRALFGRLRALLVGLDQASGGAHALANVHVFDSAALGTLVAAAEGSTGESGDWINEIHLTPDGYGKLGAAFGAWIDGVLATYPS